MADCYKVDGRKVTLREYWNISRSWKALFVWVAARLGAPMQFGVGFRQPDSVGEMEIAEREFSPEAKEKLQPLLDQCLALGFHSPRFYLYESLRRDVRTHFIAMLHGSGEFTLRLMHTLASNGNLVGENVLGVLLSELSDGTFFFTSDQREKFQVPTGIMNNRLIGGSPMQLIQSHHERIAQLKMRNPPKPVLTREALDDAWNRYEKQSLDFQLRRGLYVRMAPEEVEGQEKLVETAKAMTAEGVRHADVLVELNRLQNKKGGWGNAIWIFILSMILFVGAGSRQWSWEFVLLLVPILFVHELELTEYFSANFNQPMIPSWHPNEQRTPEQRAAHQCARKTYLKAQESSGKGHEDPRMRNLQKPMSEARRQGDETEVSALKNQIGRLSRDLARERLEKLKAGVEGAVDPMVIDRFAVWSASLTATNGEATRKALSDLAQTMGPLPEVNGVVNLMEERYSARTGYPLGKGRRVILSRVSFANINDGAPALLDWLCAKGGADIKYDILARVGVDTDEE